MSQCQCRMQGFSRCCCNVGAGHSCTATDDPLECASSSEEEDALERARAVASESRDPVGRVGVDALVNQWREVSKPRKGGAIACQPAGCKVDFHPLFEHWLAQRDLTRFLEFDREEDGWQVFRYTKEKIVKEKPRWLVAFHGSWFYSVWSILESGVILESCNKNLGHDFWEPGVYCSPSLDTGSWYARPQIIFDDDVYHRIIFELRVDPDQQKRTRKRGGIQWVFPCGAVSIHSIWVRPNAPPNNGEERVNSWDPDLEALPPGRQPPDPIKNLRVEPWPAMTDLHPFKSGHNSAPPWMTSSSACPAGDPTNDRDGRSSKKPRVCFRRQFAALAVISGPYGHWLKLLRREGSKMEPRPRSQSVYSKNVS